MLPQFTPIKLILMNADSSFFALLKSFPHNRSYITLSVGEVYFVYPVWVFSPWLWKKRDGSGGAEAKPDQAGTFRYECVPEAGALGKANLSV